MFKVSYIHISPLGSGYMGVFEHIKREKKKAKKNNKKERK